jgi:hypothetical protein
LSVDHRRRKPHSPLPPRHLWGTGVSEAELLVVAPHAIDPEDLEAGVERVLVRQVVERWHEEPLREITGCAEDHQRARWCGRHIGGESAVSPTVRPCTSLAGSSPAGCRAVRELPVAAPQMSAARLVPRRRAWH